MLGRMYVMYLKTYNIIAILLVRIKHFLQIKLEFINYTVYLKKNEIKIFDSNICRIFLNTKCNQIYRIM